MNSPQLVVNRFELHNLLGRGGMGDVYRATDKQTAEIVAVKALNPEVLKHDPSLLERFVREGEALRQLNHPNIVRMIAAVEEEGHHYLVMEFVEGGSLRDWLTTRGCLPASEVVKIALEVSDALTRAHHLRIIHRDLKPGNILLAKDGTPRLADFGIAHIQESSHLTQSGMLIGTVDYLSPEVCQGDPPHELSDIWAFGVMLFEMLTGKLPFEGKSMTAKITAILHQPIPDLGKLAPDIPDALVDLIYWMLEKDSRQRVPSVRLVGAELEAIQKGRDKTIKPVASSALPAFLEKGEDAEPPVFVTRESELAQLDRFLNRALEGHGQVAFITGDPGQGKTALTAEFARQARDKYPELVIASGNCNAYTGIGDPYLPFREILGLLCGDIESRWEARAISREQAKRLWQCIPATAQALVESARDLVEIFVSGDTLVKRVAAFSPWPGRGEWLPKLEQLVQYKASTPVDPNFQQAALFEQYTRVLRAIAHHKPLLLILDDLQWADSASINLLFHVGKRIEGSRVMILGTYRTTELALGRDGQRHPLEPILNEFKRQFGNIQIELGKSDGRRFVDAYLDSEPNHLNDNFRSTLSRMAGGHPLGTVELLRDLQERGGIVRDQSGFWVVGTNLDWEALPARLEAMIAERIERLDSIEQRVLKVASVEGETFTAEVIAQVLSEEPQTILNLLNEELDKRHRLVNAQNIHQQNGRRLSIYRFQHILFQRYLHGSLNAVERSNLHQSVGTALTELYAEGREEISGQLARHFQEAGTDVQAGDYLVQSGDRARDVYAYPEAVAHYQQAQTAYERALGEKWNMLQRVELERKIGDSLFRNGEHPRALEHLKKAMLYLGISFPETQTEMRIQIAGELIKQLGHRLIPRLFSKSTIKPVSPRVILENQLYDAIGWVIFLSNPEVLLLVALKILNLSEVRGVIGGIAVGSSTLAALMDYMGLLGIAEGYHQKSLALIEKNPSIRDRGFTFLCIAGHLEALGKIESSRESASRAANDYREIGDSHQQCFAEHIQADALYYQGNLVQSLLLSRNIITQGNENIDPQIQCWGLTAQGGALRRSGNLPDAIEILEKAIEIGESIPDWGDRIEAGGELGQCFLRQGQIEKAFSVLHKTREVYDRYGAGWGNENSVYNGLVEAYLLEAEQDQLNRKIHLQKAQRACNEARAHAKKFLPGMPETLRLQGTCEWLKGKKTTAQKLWGQGLKLAQEQGQRYDEGVTLVEMGSRLMNRGHLEKAMTILSEIGAEWDLRRAKEALEKL